MSLTVDQIRYFESLDEMFATDGWKQLVEESKAEIYQLQADAIEAQSWEQVNYLRGRAEQLAYLVRLEEVTSYQRESLLEEDEDVDSGI